MLFATTALAAEKGSMKLYDPTLVNGVQLSPGDYALQWDGTGNNLQVQILQGKKVVGQPRLRLCSAAEGLRRRRT